MKKLHIIEVKNVDMMLLQRQRQLLIAKLWDDKDSELWGLVEMLDEIEDYALENEPFNVLEDCSVHFSVSVSKDDSTANKMEKKVLQIRQVKEEIKALQGSSLIHI